MSLRDPLREDGAVVELEAVGADGRFVFGGAVGVAAVGTRGGALEVNDWFEELREMSSGVEGLGREPERLTLTT